MSLTLTAVLILDTDSKAEAQAAAEEFRHKLTQGSLTFGGITSQTTHTVKSVTVGPGPPTPTEYEEGT